VSKDVEVDPDNPVSYYNIEDEEACPNMRLFLDDINRLSSRPGSWVIPILAATGAKSRPQQFHFCYNTKKLDASYDDPNARVSDYKAFDKMYVKMSEELSEKYNYNCDKNQWYPVLNKKNIAYHLYTENVFTLRVESYVWVFDATYLAVAKSVADILNEAFEPEVVKELPPEMVTRQKGNDFGFGGYIN
jgi:voltage-gated potassium channel